MDPATIAAIATALGTLLGGASSMRKQDSPSDEASLLDWTYPDKNGKKHGSRPSFNENGKNYKYVSGQFQKPSSLVREQDKVYDDNGRLLGWFTPDGPADPNAGNRNQAVESAKTNPYRMNRGSEGEMWLGQRDNIFNQDLDFSRREAANNLSIRAENQPGTLELDRQKALYDQNTSAQVASKNMFDQHLRQQRDWQWQQQNAGLEGDAYRSRMQAMFPGASTWDLLGGSNSSSSGPGAVPGLPGMPTPSAGTQRSGPDPATVAAKLNADSQMMNTMVNAKLQQSQMQLQEGIAQRNAVLEFMNTAIQGARTPSEIKERAAAAQASIASAETEPYRRAALGSQWAVNSAQANKISKLVNPELDLINARTARERIETRNSKYGAMYSQFKSIAQSAGDNPGIEDIFALLPFLGGGKLGKYLKGTSIRARKKHHKMTPKEIERAISDTWLPDKYH